MDMVVQHKISCTKRFEQQEKVQAGLMKIPDQFNLLVIATDVYRASDDPEKSLNTLNS